MTPTSQPSLDHRSDEELLEIVETHPKERLTLAQRAQGTLDRRKDVRTAVKHYRNQATIGFVILLLGLGGVRALDLQGAEDAREAIARSGNSVAVHSCNRDFRQSLRQRNAFRVEVKRPGSNTQHLSKRELEHRIVKITPLPDCRPARTAVTDDAKKRVRIPKPLYRDPVEKRKGG